MDRLKEQLKCPVCLDTFNEPKGLACFHGFCKTCLERLPIEENAIKCPTCRQVTRLPQEGGVENLPTAFYINTLLDAHQALEKPVAFGLDDGNVPLCNLHNKVREFYCQEDDEVICSVCAVRGHKTHICDTVTEYCEPAKKEITNCLEKMNESVVFIKLAIDSSEKKIDAIKENKCEVETEIHQAIENLHRQIEIVKERLLNEVGALTKTKLQKVAEYQETLATVLAQFKSCQEFVDITLQTSSPQQILGAKRQLVNHINFLTSHNTNTSCLGVSDSAIYFNPSTEYLSIGSVCQVQFDKSTISNRTRFIGNIGELTKFCIQVRDIDNELTELPTYHSITCCQIWDSSETIKCSVRTLEKGKYLVSFIPTVAGPHVVKCLIGNKHIVGSPFITRVLPRDMYHHIKSIDNLQIPSAIAIMEDDHIVVAERGSYSVALLNSNGERIRTIGNSNVFGILSGVAVKEGSLLVVDTGYNRIWQYSVDGILLNSVGNDINFNLPYSVAVHPNGTVYVVDRNNFCIHAFRSDLTYAFAFGTKGKNSGQFNTPFDIAIDSKGYIYVSDPKLKRVQKFNEDGIFMSSIDVQSPFFLCIDSQDILYVMEQREPVRGLFTLVHHVTHDHFITMINCSCEDSTVMVYLGEFQWSRKCNDYGCSARITIDKSGFIYILDPFEGCIYIC